MITRIDGKNKLRIFENFSIDRNLKKYKSKNYSSNIISVAVNTNTATNIITGATTGFNGLTTWSQADVEPNQMDAMMPVPMNPMQFPSPSIIIGEGISGDPDILTMREMLAYSNDFWERMGIRFKYYFHKLKSKFKKKTKPAEVNYVALQDFFKRIPFQNIEQSVELVKYYEDALLHVEKTGQTALKEKLKNILSIVRAEIALLDNKMIKFVAEEQMVSLYEKVNANEKLKLTWIKNFIKIIPTDVLKLKEAADNLEIFDNYVILHYDPNNDATNLTEEEVRAKKDPIMFGVIQNSNKLYYIADWIDEYCDMTLEKMFNVLGDKVLEINNESVKSFINNQR